MNANLSQEFSIALQNRFLQRSGLKGTTENPDVLIEGEITDYSISPTTISTPVTTDGGNIQAAQNKLTITVKFITKTVSFQKQVLIERIQTKRFSVVI